MGPRPHPSLHCARRRRMLESSAARARCRDSIASRMVGKLLIPEIRDFIAERNFGALRDVFREWPPADVAEVILDLPEDEQVIIFRLLPNALAADVFEYLDSDA